MRLRICSSVMRGRSAMGANHSKTRLPRVYPILDTATVAARGARCIPVAEAMISGGAGVLQYRHKGFWDRERFAEARAIASLCLSVGIPFIVNDRADYAAVLF